MSDAEETPAQRQARIRRQKREAKINANATERLDRITRASGRTPESMRNESPAATTSPATLESTPSRTLPPSLAQAEGTADPDQSRLQEEYLRTLLGGTPQQQGGQGQAGQTQDPSMDDPMMKMLSQMMGGMNGDPNAPGGVQFNPDDLSKATGLPSFVTNMLFGNKKAPPTPEEERQIRLWRVLHVVFAITAGLYLMFTIDRSTNMFGANPPSPATFQNPFTIFALGELFLQSARMITAGPSGKRGPGLWLQMLRESAGDGAIMIFLLGVSSWLKGFT